MCSVYVYMSVCMYVHVSVYVHMNVLAYESLYRQPTYDDPLSSSQQFAYQTMVAKQSIRVC